MKLLRHISNKRLDTKVAVPACDVLSEEGLLKVLFKSNSFLNFVQQILNRPSFYQNIDPVEAVFSTFIMMGTVTTGTLMSPAGRQQFCYKKQRW